MLHHTQPVMKTRKILFVALIIFMLPSCVSTSYFQVYKTVPTEKLVVSDNNLIYEDGNCKVFYNLWSEGGNIGFKFFNKSDKNIYLNLEESFFIQNGISYNYYKSRVFAASTSSGTTASTTKSATGLNSLNGILPVNTAGVTATSGLSVSYNEEKLVCIPSKTFKIISEYNIHRSFFRDCDLLRYPTKKQVKSKAFSKEQSPLVFSNRIAYSIGQTDVLIKFENEFYVSEITNYPESEMFEMRYQEFCGQKNTVKQNYFKNVSADKFYIKYIKGTENWKH